MKKLFLLLCLLPLLVFCKNENPCDYYHDTVYTDSTLDASAICNKAFNVVTQYKGGPFDKYNAVKASDSLIIVIGTIRVNKVKGFMVHDKFGRMTIPYHSDGDISFKMRIKCSKGSYYYEFVELNHSNCKNSYGNICAYGTRGNPTTMGLRYYFLKEMTKLVQMLKEVV